MSRRDTSICGFAVWEHRDVMAEDGTDFPMSIHVCYFGLDGQYQGKVTRDGYKLADALFATVVGQAKEHKDTSPGAWLHLYCDTRNERGHAFWQRQGFSDREVRAPTPDESYFRMMRLLPE